MPTSTLASILDTHACSWHCSLFSSHVAPRELVFVGVTKFRNCQPGTCTLAMLFTHPTHCKLPLPPALAPRALLSHSSAVLTSAAISADPADQGVFQNMATLVSGALLSCFPPEPSCGRVSVSFAQFPLPLPSQKCGGSSGLSPAALLTRTLSLGHLHRGSHVVLGPQAMMGAVFRPGGWQV